MNSPKEMKECPYCGSEEYYIKQSFKGTCEYIFRFDGKKDEVDNGHIHDNIQYKITSKYAYCRECDKRLFKINE